MTVTEFWKNVDRIGWNEFKSIPLRDRIMLGKSKTNGMDTCEMKRIANELFKTAISHFRPSENSDVSREFLVWEVIGSGKDAYSAFIQDPITESQHYSGQPGFSYIFSRKKDMHYM